MRTSEVAGLAGVNVQTLRYYERRGLIAEPARSLGGHRTYPADTVTLVGFIKAAQRLGFTLDEVAELIDTGRRRHPPPDLRERAAEKIVEVDAKIAQLRAIRDQLTRVVDARCDSLTNWPCRDTERRGRRRRTAGAVRRGRRADARRRRHVVVAPPVRPALTRPFALDIPPLPDVMGRWVGSDRPIDQAFDPRVLRKRMSVNLTAPVALID
jgi:DNA-binding transcriptional MerR regulator